MAKKKRPIDPDIEAFADTEPGLGPQSAGQAGDLQGLPRRARAASESVEELVEEGQAWEASAISGVEDAEDANGNPAEVRTHEIPEDDVPEEYRDERENG